MGDSCPTCGRPAVVVGVEVEEIVYGPGRDVVLPIEVSLLLCGHYVTRDPLDA